jgi:hypothetical protein
MRNGKTHYDALVDDDPPFETQYPRSNDVDPVDTNLVRNV